MENKEVHVSLKFANKKGYMWEVVDTSVSREIVIKSLEDVPYITTVRKEAIQKGNVMYPYGKNKHGGYRGEGEWNATNSNPLYKHWKGMLERVVTVYEGVSVCKDWYNLNLFCDWAIQKYVQGHELDKDILGDGTIYSPFTCCFVPKEVNLFTTSLKQFNCTESATGFRLWCRDGGVNGKHYRGTFPNRSDCISAWKEIKLNRLEELAKTYTLDRNIVNALRNKIGELI